MKLAASILSMAAALALAGPANAAVLVTSTGAAVTDFSEAGSVAFDLDLETLGTTRLGFMLEEEDLLGPLSLNAVVRNLSGKALNQFIFKLSGIDYAGAGSVTPTFGTLDKVSTGADIAHIAFGRPEWAEFHFGNPFLLDNASNWLLDTRGLSAGQRFTITATVPEPGSLALLLPALGLAGWMGRRRTR